MQNITFCPVCGASVEGGMPICPACGMPLNGNSQSASAQPQFEQPNFSQNEPFGQNQTFSQNEPFGQNQSFNQNEPFGQNQSFGQNEPFGQNQSFNQNEPFGQNQSFGQNPSDFGQQNSGSWNQPQYQQPSAPQWNGYGAYTSNSGNGLAIAGMVIGIVSILLFCLTWIDALIAVTGLILSCVGLRSVKYKGCAIAGLVCSVVGVIASGFYFIYILSIM
ncbi:MAG: hypothetical protein ACI4JD_05520 [Ruminococcus sp.]